MNRGLFVVALLIGCGKGSTETKATEEDPAVSYVASSATESIPKIKAALKTTKPGDAIFKCAQMANIDTLKNSPAHAALAAELEQLCTHDLPLAMIRVAVEAAEVARKATPDGVLSECFSAELKTAEDDLKQAGKLAAAKDLLARYLVVCPDSK